jgi:hypothetical protein
VFVVGVVLFAVQGNGRLMQHPVALIVLGTWPAFLGLLLVGQPRTYVEGLCLQRMLRLAEKGRDIDEDALRKNLRRDTILAVFGGLFILIVGLIFLVGGIAGL